MIIKNDNCLNCGKELNIHQKYKKGLFCSKGCATSYRQRANDPNFFKLVDNRDAMYICGLIFSDGNLSKNKDRITLGVKDFDIISKIYPYFCDTGKRKIYKNKRNNCSEFYTIISTNKESIDLLIEFGIVPNKSHILEFPNHLSLNENFSDFIRGFFDGDGCVYISNTFRNKNYLAISFTCGSEKFIRGLSNYFESIRIHNTITIDKRVINKENKVYYLKIYSQKDIKSFYDLIYSNEPNLFLKRKRDIFNKNIV